VLLFNKKKGTKVSLGNVFIRLEKQKVKNDHEEMKCILLSFVLRQNTSSKREARGAADENIIMCALSP